ncbi:hypothetical protein [Melittangium boletus]|uniref:Uncharacterized protein n=1 Tax=Melittangium boletus DSM 14713 TaxID=1294270 RepID=A0A250IGR4_9BACT|nr:hypothetical protein [Melittangium boletus]ATB30347.1 hypothetical protein MEBOL_003807 [Melittangium boletus DSM 14713]
MRALLLCVLLSGTLVTAQPLAARDTADVGPRGSWSVGLFNPLRFSPMDGVEFQTHPLTFFVAPNANARVALLRSSLRLTTEAGLSLPTFALRLTKGYLFPLWATSDNDIGWMLIPRAGLVLSGDASRRGVWTVKADAAFRIALGPHNASPLNFMSTPLELLLAAPLTGLSTRVGGAYDHALTERLRVRGELNLYVTGSQGHLVVSGQDVGAIAAMSPLFVTAHVGFDLAVFRHSRVTLGAMWANADQGATKLVTGADGYSERQRVRSNDFMPTLDFIWAGL